MHKKPRGKLALHRETLRNLDAVELARAAGGDESSFSETPILCMPSAVQSRCHTYCPDFTCTRQPADPGPL